MRDMLFRAKSICADSPGDTSHNYWVEGSLIHQTEFYGDPVDVYHIVKVGEFHCDYYDSEEVWPETVGQFTGLYDRNDKKIYEGDIVKTKYGRLCIVVWFANQVHNGWDLEVIRTVENCVHTRYPDSIDLYKKENLEVVGNIHDNPEMLKEKNYE